MKTVLTYVVLLGLVWLLVGVVAALQKGYFSDQDCARAVEDAQMVAWGPLSYVPDLEFLPGACVQPVGGARRS